MLKNRRCKNEGIFGVLRVGSFLSNGINISISERYGELMFSKCDINLGFQVVLYITLQHYKNKNIHIKIRKKKS